MFELCEILDGVKRKQQRFLQPAAKADWIRGLGEFLSLIYP